MAPIHRPPAEIHILKPEGGKAFVEATQLQPHRPRNHQKRPRRLFYLETGGIVHAQTAIPPGPRVCSADFYKELGFPNPGCRRGKVAGPESGLGPALCVEQTT